MPYVSAVVSANHDAGETLDRAGEGLPQQEADIGVRARRWRWTGSIPWASTSAPAPGRCTAAPTRAGRGRAIGRTTCRRSGRWRPWSLPRPCGAAVVLTCPRCSPPCSPDCPSRIEATGATVAAVIRDVDRRVPGLANRVLDAGPSLRRHLNVLVAGERAGAENAVPAARGCRPDPRGVGAADRDDPAGRAPLARGRPARSPGRRAWST